MKKLFFLLLAANVGFFLWHFMIEMPRGFDGSDNLDLHLPDGVETIVLVSELDKNFGSVAKSHARSQIAIHTPENTTESTDSWSIVGTMSKQALDQIANIQYSLVVDSIVHDLETAYEIVADSIVEKFVEGMGQIDLTEKFDSRPKTSQKSVDIRSPENVGSKTKQCYELGPFSTMEAVKAIASSIDSKAAWHQITSSMDDVNVGFWILYRPNWPPESFEESRANLVMLKARGIKDTWLFSAGELRGSISLGLFKNKARAISISNKLRGKGINSKVQPCIAKIEQYRLKVRWNDTQTLLESWLVPYSGKAQEIQISVIENCGGGGAKNKLARISHNFRSNCSDYS